MQVALHEFSNDVGVVFGGVYIVQVEDIGRVGEGFEGGDLVL